MSLRTFCVASFALAAMCMVATWDARLSVASQSWAVPLWIALTPFLFRGRFEREARERGAIESLVGKMRTLVLGMAVVQFVNIAMARAGIVAWRDVTFVLGAAALVQIAAVVVAVRKGFVKNGDG